MDMLVNMVRLNCPADGSNRDGVCYCNDTSDQVYGMCARDKKTNASDKDKKGDGYHVWVYNLKRIRTKHCGYGFKISTNKYCT